MPLNRAEVPKWNPLGRYRKFHFRAVLEAQNFFEIALVIRRRSSWTFKAGLMIGPKKLT